MAQDPVLGRTDGPRRLDIGPFPYRPANAADQASEHRDLREDDDEEHGAQTRPEQHGQGDGQQDRRERQEQVEGALDEGVRPGEADREQSEGRPEHSAGRYRSHDDEQVDPDAVEGAGEEVLVDGVGAEPVTG